MEPHFRSSCESAALAQIAARCLSLIKDLGGAVVLFCALIPCAARAQTFTSLLSFNGTDGASPVFAVLAQGLDGTCTERRRGGEHTARARSSRSLPAER